MSGEAHSELEALRRRFKRERATRLEAEAIAERAISQWYLADRVKSALLDTVAHELRTPLTAIKGFSEMALKRWDQLTEEQRLLFLSNVRENAVALGELIDDILDFGRLDKGAVTLALEPVELGAYPHQLVDRLSGSFDDHSLRVDIV